jgi:hypothetical protein
MDLLSWENAYYFGYIFFWYILWAPGVIYGAIKTYQTLTGKIGTGFAWNRARKLDVLRKRRDWLIELHKSDRTYYGWLLSSILWVLTLLAAEIALEGMMVPPTGFTAEALYIHVVLRHLLRFFLGYTAFVLALGRLGDYRALQRFDRAKERIDRAIAKLEAKRLLPPAATTMHEQRP